MAETSVPTSRRTIEHPERIAGTVYGTMIALAAIAVGTDERDAWRLVVLVAAGSIAIWLAHVYAHSLGESIEDGVRVNRTRVSRIARRELSIPLAAALPCALLAAGAIGLLEESTAVWLALGAGILTLGVQGARYARIEGVRGAPGAVIVLVNVLLGLGIVGIKVFVLLFH